MSKAKAREVVEARLALLEHVAHGLDATTERIPPELSPGEMWLEIRAPGGLALTVTLEIGQPDHDWHLVAWHVCTDGVRLRPDFGEVNPVHGRKATHTADGFSGLMVEIERGLTRARDGSAYC